MNNRLLNGVLAAGLIQFGHFADPDHQEAQPVRLQLEMLAAYPALLREIGQAAAAHLANQGIERLVCPHDSLPVGVVVSQMLDIPLVYSRGKIDAPVHDLVGAYDVGHPAAFIVNGYDGQTDAMLQALTRSAARVGLHLAGGIAVVSLKRVEDINRVKPLITLVDALADLVADGWLTGPQRETVARWLDRQ